MNGQKFVLATLAGGVTLFLLGFVIYGVALMGFMTEHTLAAAAKETPDFVHLALGQLVGGALLTVVIGHWAKTGGVGPGMMIGAQLGFLVWACVDLTMFATSNLMTDFVVVPVDVLGGVILNAGAGAVVGAVLGKKS